MSVDKAKIAEQAERYEDMAQEMKGLVESMGDESLSVENRNLLSVAYKNVVGSRRSALRILDNIKGKTKEEEQATLQIIKDYKDTIEKELEDYCKEVLTLIEKLFNKEAKDEGKVFYHKMKADYYRYLAEFSATETNIGGARDAYTSAQEIAEAKLVATHPIRLGLALNFSVFYYEIVKNQSEACKLAKKAFDDAIAVIDTVEETDYKDSTLIMQLLRDNLTLWTSDQASDNEDDKEGDN